MGDMVALENLVANTIYLKAQWAEDKEMRKRRQGLSLPKLNQCAALRATIKREYKYLCEAQPIGRRLFRHFLKALMPQYLSAAEFVDELKEWTLAEEGARDKVRQGIINKFCLGDSPCSLSYLTGDVADKCKKVSDKDFQAVMMDMKKTTKEFLCGKPFTQYLASPFFDMFLRWKEYERRTICEKYFYEFRTLGKGGFGEVCAVQVKITGQMYACKKLEKKRLKKGNGERLALLEKQILEKVNSQFVVNLAYAFDTRTHLCLVMTLMSGGDLKFHIYYIGERGLKLERVVHYTAQITTGLLHLHAMSIVYRDMKPENVLLDSRGHCRLSDLGLAVELTEDQSICQKAGTTGYMAPEILKQCSYGTSVDWWALGCSVYEMLAARLPFKDYKEKVQKEEVVRRTMEDDCRFEHKLNGPSKSLISQLLKRRVEYRLGSRGDDPRKHEFFKSINFPRLEAGLVAAPWVPDPNVVYAKDTGDFHDYSEATAVELDAKDDKFFKEFSTGASSIPWQEEMISSGLFDELNDPNRKESVVELTDEDLKKFKSKSCVIL
ncbi:LOW QUALITY PROTEIN: rhodopsin kinase grk7-b [Aplochiton taeniatus]